MSYPVITLILIKIIYSNIDFIKLFCYDLIFVVSLNLNEKKNFLNCVS